MKSLFLRSCAILSIVSLSACGNKSSICTSAEVVSQISAKAKADMLMYDIIRSETKEPPYRQDAKWIKLDTSLAALKSLLGKNDDQFQVAYKECINQPDGEMNEQAFAQFGFIEAAVAVQVSAALSMTGPAQKLAIYEQVCNGDFSSLSRDQALGPKVADGVMPNRYRYWYNKVRPLSETRTELSKKISNTETEIFQYQENYFDNSFKKIKYNISESSLDKVASIDTNFECSANISTDVNGWSVISKNINYNVKITESGKSKVVVREDDDYKKMLPYAEDGEPFDGLSGSDY